MVRTHSRMMNGKGNSAVRPKWIVIAGLLAVGARGYGATAVLYDAGLGTRPSAQGWTYLADPIFGAAARESFADGAALLDTTPVVSDKAGWFSNLPPFPRHSAQPELNAERGFLVSFEMRLGTEQHNTDHRAGFSVIVIAADLSAIELGFWTNQVWAQSGPDFRHAETAELDTATVSKRYDLEIRRGSYRLSLDGAQVLIGELRRYDSFGLPYQIPEFLFFGDDTTSAAGRAEVRRITVGDLPSLVMVRDGDGWRLEAEAETGRWVRWEASGELTSWVEVGQARSEDGRARMRIEPGPGATFFRVSLR
jgi:hypothetical protein